MTTGAAARLQARLAAVLGARRAFIERQVGADRALRQSLVDLASVCELLAGELEPPKPGASGNPAGSP